MDNNQIILSNSGASLQMMPLNEAKSWYSDFVNFSKSIMKEGLDYGVIPGTPKPSLYKAGAEKLRFVYGLTTEVECIEKILDLDRPFILYVYRCTVKAKNGQVLAQCEGACNSMEGKYGYVWKTITELPEGTDITTLPSKTSGKKLSEFAFAVDKAETTGPYGKPAEYWQKFHDAIQAGTAREVKKKSSRNNILLAWELDETVTVYRIPNIDVMNNQNTIMKMAQKRAFVGAMLLATGASEFFTQDLEDMEINGQIHSEQTHSQAPAATQPQQPYAGEAPPWPEEAIVVTEDDPLDQWRQSINQCKTPKEVDELALKEKSVVEHWPELKNLFIQRKAQLRKQKETQHA